MDYALGPPIGALCIAISLFHISIIFGTMILRKLNKKSGSRPSLKTKRVARTKKKKSSKSLKLEKNQPRIDDALHNVLNIGTKKSRTEEAGPSSLE